MGQYITTGFATITAASGTTAVTGVGFQPTAIFFYYPQHTRTTGGGHSGSARDPDGYGFGMATADGSNYASVGTLVGNVDNHPARRMWKSGSCMIKGDGDMNPCWGAVYVSSFDSDGFTLTTQDTIDYTTGIGYIAFQAPNASIVTFNNSSTTGNQSVTGVGFQPGAVFFMCAPGAEASSYTDTDADQHNMFGWTDGTNSAVFHWYDQNGVGAVNNWQNFNATECINAALADRARIVSFDSDGFTLTWDEAGGNYTHIALCLGGVESYATTSSTVGNTTDQTVTGFGFEPELIMAMTTRDVGGFDTVNAANTDLMFSLGSATGLTESFVNGLQINHGASVTCDTDNYLRFNDGYIGANFANETFWGDFLMVSWDSDGFTWKMGTASAGRPIAFFGMRVVPTDYRDRLVRYLHNTHQSGKLGRASFRDIVGREVPPHQLEVDNWAFSGGALWPTPVKYENMLEDPNVFYFESLKPSDAEVAVETDRESYFESIMRKLGAS